MGSPSYIAPETWRGNSATLDGRADLFALAVIVFRWLTGALPFDQLDLIGQDDRRHERASAKRGRAAAGPSGGRRRLVQPRAGGRTGRSLSNRRRLLRCARGGAPWRAVVERQRRHFPVSARSRSTGGRATQERVGHGLGQGRIVAEALHASTRARSARDRAGSSSGSDCAGSNSSAGSGGTPYPS